MLGLKAFDDEMAAGHVLEMVDEQNVDDAAAGGAHDRNRFGGDLFGDHDSETGGNRGDQAHDFGVLAAGAQTFTTLSIFDHSDGLSVDDVEVGGEWVRR